MKLKDFEIIAQKYPDSERISIKRNRLASDTRFFKSNSFYKKILSNIKLFLNKNRSNRFKRKNKETISCLLHVIREDVGDKAAQDAHFYVLKATYAEGLPLTSELINRTIDEVNRSYQKFPSKDALSHALSLDFSKKEITNNDLAWLLHDVDLEDLQSLDLSENKLSNESARIIAEAVNTGKLKSLKKLNLANNEIGDIGAIYLAKSGLFYHLEEPRHAILDVTGNKIEAQGFDELRKSKYTVVGYSQFLHKENNAA